MRQGHIQRRVAAVAGAIAALWLVTETGAEAADLQADPSNYRDMLSQLQPGDTLHLAAGTYEHLLNITNLNGSENAWITITGPESGDPAVFVADPGPCCNTVEIRNSSYVAIRHITVDGNHVAGAFGLSAKDGTSNLVHHIRVEYCTFINHEASQQTVAISTKTPTWGWEIRHNHIVDAGTGLYLGNSNGTMPFVGGLIEYNLIENTVGYNMEIKWQQPRPDVEGMPTTPQRTIIRHNVFIKDDRPSPDGDRPNLLVGGFPDSGPGSEDLYEIYGNFFYHNPRESLLQVSGRVSIHDNVFVDVAGTAILLRNHDLPLKLAHVYNNTIYAAGRGISVASQATEEALVVGNLVFSDSPITGQADLEADNVTDSVAAASNYVNAPSTTLGEMDFYPIPASPARGSAMDLSAFSGETDYDRDFNDQDKADFTYRGAYAGEGENPGWQLDRGIQDEPANPHLNPDGGMGDGGTTGNDAGSGSDASTESDGDSATADGGASTDHSSGGCGCRSHAGGGPVTMLILVLLWGTVRLTRNRNKKSVTIRHRTPDTRLDWPQSCRHPNKRENSPRRCTKLGHGPCCSTTNHPTITGNKRRACKHVDLTRYRCY